MKKYWLLGTIGAMFLLPAIAGIPVAVSNGKQYWLLWAVFRPDNASLLDTGLEAFYWISSLSSLGIAIYCFVKLIRTADDK